MGHFKSCSNVSLQSDLSISGYMDGELHHPLNLASKAQKYLLIFKTHLCNSMQHTHTPSKTNQTYEAYLITNMQTSKQAQRDTEVHNKVFMLVYHCTFQLADISNISFDIC